MPLQMHLISALHLHACWRTSMHMHGYRPFQGRHQALAVGLCEEMGWNSFIMYV